MNENLSHLQYLSTQLNNSSDSLTETLKEVEAKLAALRLGIEQWRIIKEAQYVDAGLQLGYAKQGGSWRLLLREYTVSEEGYCTDADAVPMLESPRVLRLAAVQHLPALVSQILDTATAEAEAVEKGRLAAESALALLQ